MCNFAVQTVVCGNISTNFSNPIGINTHILYTNTVYIASISSLAIALIVSIVGLLSVIVIMLRRSKAKTKAVLDLQATSTAVRSSHIESMYEDPIPSVSAIRTQDNVAYGHTKTTTTTQT